jgi:uridine kinase
MDNHATPLVIGIAGGSGSGKTTFANVIMSRVGAQYIAYLPHDAYYKDLKMLPPNQKAEINFDHPDSLDTDLMIEHIQALKRWEPVEIPTYDFTRDRRTEITITIRPRPIILVEGILIFAIPELLPNFDVKIFVDTDPDIRFIRRLQRDIYQRGRTTESVIEKYLVTVRPMHLKFVEPSRRYADVIVPEGGHNMVAMDMIVARIQTILSKRSEFQKEK